MYFTQEDYLKIERWLQSKGKKDTEFSKASTPLTGSETIAFVQNGHNVNAYVKDIVNQLFLLGISDFLNVTDKYNERLISLNQAINLIPYRSRKVGQVITFLNEEDKWVIYQFRGKLLNQWNNVTLWVDIVSSLTVTEVQADEEDITGIKTKDITILKFKDKVYNQDDYSGLGRVYLRKNIVQLDCVGCSPINLLTQEMVGKENTIYIIQYDYNLNNLAINIPANCILQFNGGSITGGTININNTLMVGDIKVTSTINGLYRKGQRLFDNDKGQYIVWDGSNWLNEDGSLTSKVVII